MANEKGLKIREKNFPNLPEMPLRIVVSKLALSQRTLCSDKI